MRKQPASMRRKIKEAKKEILASTEREKNSKKRAILSKEKVYPF